MMTSNDPLLPHCLEDFLTLVLVLVLHECRLLADLILLGQLVLLIDHPFLQMGQGDLHPAIDLALGKERDHAHQWTRLQVRRVG